jgi:hypothetical protein
MLKRHKLRFAKLAPVLAILFYKPEFKYPHSSGARLAVLISHYLNFVYHKDPALMLKWHKLRFAKLAPVLAIYSIKATRYASSSGASLA